jgi:hypothetical protein
MRRILREIKYYLWIAPSLWWRDFRQVLSMALLALIAVFYLIPRGYILTKRENNEKIIDFRAFANLIGRFLTFTGNALSKRFGNEGTP